MEQIENVILEKVKAQHKRTGGANGLNTYGLAAELNITDAKLREVVDKLISEKKIVYLNHLNGRDLTLPK